MSGPPTTDALDRQRTPALDYETWNRRLIGHFFSEDNRFSRIRLGIDDDTLFRLGGSASDLAHATVQRAGSLTIQDLGLELYHAWSDSNERADPPFLAILVIYVLSVNHGGDEFAAHAYYDRLHDLLDSPQQRIGSLEDSLPLWKGLEQWSKYRTGGRRGIFEVEILGSHEHVGIPRRQVLIAKREEGPLRRAFWSAGLRPGATPADRRLVQSVKNASGLLTRTRRLLAAWPRESAAIELVAEIRSRLEDWDPSEFGDGQDDADLMLPLKLALRVAGPRILDAQFETELVGGITDQDHELLAVRSPQDPEPGSKYRLRVGETNSMRPVVIDDCDDPSWATSASWFDAIEFDIEGTGATMFRPPNPYRIFGRGDRAGVLEEFYSQDLQPGDQYLLVMPRETASEDGLDFVGTLGARPWQPCGDVQPDAVCRPFRASDQVAQQAEWRPRIGFQGGIPSGRGQRAYIHFALPSIFIDKNVDTSRVDINARALNDRGQRIGGPIPLIIGNDAPTDSLIGGSSLRVVAEVPQLPSGCQSVDVSAQVDGRPAPSRSFFVDRRPVVDELEQPQPRDGYGLPAPIGSAHVFRGLETPREPQLRAPSLPTAFSTMPDAREIPDDVGGRRLMQLMRVLSVVSWSEAKRKFPGCLPASSDELADSTYFTHEVSALHSLGIIEIEEGDEGRFENLRALSPQLLLLPRLANRGLRNRHEGIWTSSEVVLTGCWLPEQLAKLKREARPRNGVEYDETAHGSGTILTPHRRALLATGTSALQNLAYVAARVGVPFDRSMPLAYRFAHALSPIDKLAEHLRWEPGRPADSYRTRFFDPRRLGVTEIPLDDGDRYELWECRLPTRPEWHFFLVDREDQKRTRVPDRQIARWFVRVRAVPDAPIPVTQDELVVPLELRLPRILERSLVLSSGYAPVLRRYVGVHSPFSEAAISHRFAIPAPPERPVDWLAFRKHCTGNFCCYRGAYQTAAWPANEPLPLIGVSAESVRGLGLES